LAKVGRVGSVIEADDAERSVRPEVMEIGNETEGMRFLFKVVGGGVDGCIGKGEMS
jgi:hypothetical protein